MNMDPIGGWGFTPPRRHVNPHLRGGGWGVKALYNHRPPRPPCGGGTGLRHPLQQEPVDLGSSTEGVRGCVVEADATEVGIANVVGKRHLAVALATVAIRIDAIHTIVGVFGLGSMGRIGGVKGGDTGGEGGGVHHADTMIDLL